jgi:hypothetical protein
MLPHEIGGLFSAEMLRLVEDAEPLNQCFIGDLCGFSVPQRRKKADRIDKQ